ncbi:hypothetical protein C8Q76DRAFT_342784 [Earliella scabrosa]|nr:hypothetical protein C8Q76DRAFT_342784 [Earliella scabrosa]
MDLFLSLDWSSYPPQYADIGLYPWKRITSFSVQLTRHTVSAIFRYIWSLPVLRDLELSFEHRAIRIPRCKLPPFPCKALRSLTILDWSGTLAVPSLAFGTRVTRLRLHLKSELSDALLGCIRMAEHLETLYLSLIGSYPDGVRSQKPALEKQFRMFRTILDCVTARNVLHSVGFQLYHTQFFADRGELLDLLCADNVMAGLRSFPRLRRFSFALFENDQRFDNGWWTNQISRRFPEDIRAAVRIEVTCRWDDQHTRLWYTPAQHLLADRLNHSKHRVLTENPVKDDSIFIWDWEATPQQSPWNSPLTNAEQVIPDTLNAFISRTG